MGVMKSGRVTGRAITKNRDKGRSTRLLQAEITAPEDVQTVEHITQSGEDTSPPDNAQVVILDIGRAWKIAIATDDQIQPVALPGEKKIYSTNQAGDTEQASVFLKQDGTVEVDNGAVKLTFAPDGSVLLDADGDITLKSATKVSIDSPTLDHNGVNVGDDHQHSGVTPGGGTTGGPV